MIALRLNRVSLNTLWLIASRVLTQALSAITLILLARALGADGLGRYAAITSVIFVLNAITTYGTDTLLIREVAADASQAQRWLPASLAVQIALSIAAFVTLTLVPASNSMRLYSLSLFPMAVSTVYSAVLRGHERMDLYMGFTVGTAAAQTLGVAVVLGARGELNGVMLALIAAQTLGAVLAVMAAHTRLPDFRIAWRVDAGLVRRILHLGLPLVLLMGLSLIYQRLAIFMLNSMAGDAATGYFSAAARLIEACKMVPAAILGALFPVLAREQSPTWRIDGQVGGLFVAALSMAGVMQISAPLIIPMLFGTDYAPAIPILPILGWSLLPYTLAAWFSLRLVAAKRERTVLAAILIVVPLSLALHVALIARMSLQGAAIATLISEALQASILLILAWRR